MNGLILLRFQSKANKAAAKWHRREETLRTIRWAVEQSVDDDAKMGTALAVLLALPASGLLEDDDEALLQSVSEALLAGSEYQYLEEGFTMAVEDDELPDDEEGGIE